MVIFEVDLACFQAFKRERISEIENKRGGETVIAEADKQYESNTGGGSGGESESLWVGRGRRRFAASRF